MPADNTFWEALYFSALRQKFDLGTLSYLEPGGRAVYSSKGGSATDFVKFMEAALARSPFYEEALVQHAGALASLPADEFLLRAAAYPQQHQSALGVRVQGDRVMVDGKEVAELLPEQSGIKRSSAVDPAARAKGYAAARLKQGVSDAVAEPEIAACRAFLSSNGYDLAVSKLEAAFKAKKERTFFVVPTAGGWCGGDGKRGCSEHRIPSPRSDQRPLFSLFTRKASPRSPATPRSTPRTPATPRSLTPATPKSLTPATPKSSTRSASSRSPSPWNASSSRSASPSLEKTFDEVYGRSRT